MIDIKDYREHPEKYIQWAKDKWSTIDWDAFASLDTKVRSLKHQLDEMNAKRNELSKSIQTLEKWSDAFKAVVAEVQSMKWSLWEKQTEYDEAFEVFQTILLTIPSPALADVPVGSEHDNQVITTVHEKPAFDFEPKTHWDILEAKWYLDQDRAVKLSWSRFQIVRGGLAELQFALMQWVSQKLIKKWFELTLVPQLVREDAMKTTGFLPNEASNLYRVNWKIKKWWIEQLREEKIKLELCLYENEWKNIINFNDYEIKIFDNTFNWETSYWIIESALNYVKETIDEFEKMKNESKIEVKFESEREEDDLRLIWTAEVPLIGQHAGETFDVEELPKRYVWFSSCYRREAGTYGKDTKGLIRLHQFEKVEMVSFVRPQDAEKEHEMLFAIENEIFSELGLHYQQILIATGDLWAPAAKKYDLEAWFPWIGSFKEVTSTSNTTDFQTRRGNIKVKDGVDKYYAYSLNGTATALWRALACIVETYQTSEGDIRVPDVLKPWMSREII